MKRLIILVALIFTTTAQAKGSYSIDAFYSTANDSIMKADITINSKSVEEIKCRVYKNNKIVGSGKRFVNGNTGWHEMYITVNQTGDEIRCQVVTF